MRSEKRGVGMKQYMYYKLKRQFPDRPATKQAAEKQLAALFQSLREKARSGPGLALALKFRGRAKEKKLGDG